MSDKEKELYFDGDVDLRAIPVDKISQLSEAGLKKYFALVEKERLSRLKTSFKTKLLAWWEKIKVGGTRTKDTAITAAAIILSIYGVGLIFKWW